MKRVLTLLVFTCFLLQTQAQNIYDLVSQDPNYSIFLTAATEAGLSEILQSSSVTVFLPSNEAFAKLPEESLKRFGEDRSALYDVLKYHIVLGVLGSDAVVNYPAVLTLNGKYLSPSLLNGVFLADGVSVSQSDIVANNGIVHAVSNVILPPSFEQSLVPEVTEAITSDVVTNNETSSVVEPVQADALSETLPPVAISTAQLDNALEDTTLVRYSLTTRNKSGVFGSVVLKGNETQTIISVLLSGTVLEKRHPVKIHLGNCASAGQMLIDLNDVNGSNGISRSLVNIGISELMNSDAYINVQLSPEQPNFDIACGEFGLLLGGQ